MSASKICGRCGTERAIESFIKPTHTVCKECRRLRKQAWFQKWYPLNMAKHRSYSKKGYDLMDPDKRRQKNKAHAAKWYRENKARANMLARKWLENNRGQFYALNARRRAINKRAAPKWANHFFISEIYDLARLRTKTWGVKMEVDHVVPLRHRLVCGLHVEHNLRIIPKVENARKHNSWWPDMPTLVEQ